MIAALEALPFSIREIKSPRLYWRTLYFHSTSTLKSILTRFVIFFFLRKSKQKLMTDPALPPTFPLRLFDPTFLTMIDLYKLIFTLLATNSIINAYHAVQSPRSPSRLWETGLYTHPVKSMFVGDYSNLSQHTRDNKKGKTKGSDGGHEYVCASAVNHPSREDMLVFKYFYNNFYCKWRWL